MLIGTVPEGAIDDIRFYIGVKDGLRRSVPVEGDSRTYASQRQYIIRLSTNVQREDPQFRLLSENQELSGSIGAGFSTRLNELKTGRTGASVSRSVWEAEMRTSSTVTTAPVRVFGLPQRMNTVNVHGEVQIRSYRPDVLACEFVGLMYRLRVPLIINII